MKKLLILIAIIFSVPSYGQLWDTYYRALNYSEVKDRPILFLVENADSTHVIRLDVLEAVFKDSSYYSVYYLPTEAPSAPRTGETYYDTSEDKMYVWTGASWVDMTSQGDISWGTLTDEQALVFGTNGGDIDSDGSLTFNPSIPYVKVQNELGAAGLQMSSDGGVNSSYVSTFTDDLYFRSSDDMYFTANNLYIGASYASNAYITGRASNNSNINLFALAPYSTATSVFTVDSLGYVTGVRYYLNDENTYLSEDGSGNLVLTDAVTGAKTLAELSAGGGWTPTGYATRTSISSTITDDATVIPDAKAVYDYAQALADTLGFVAGGGLEITELTNKDSIHLEDDAILAVKLNTTNSPSDGQVYTYDSGSGGGTWEDQSGGDSGVWGSITGTLTDQTDLVNYVADSAISPNDTLGFVAGGGLEITQLTNKDSIHLEDDGILAVKLNTTNSPSDGQVYTYDLSSGGGTWEDQSGGGTSYDSTYIHYRVDSLATKLAESEAQVTLLWAAINSLGLGDFAPPVFLSAELGTYSDSILLVLMDSTDIQQDSIPPTSAWTLTENGTTFGIEAVDINYDSVFIALDSSGLVDATYLLDYTKGFPALQDSSENITLSWTDKAVTNNLIEGYSDDFESYSTGSLNGQGDWVVNHDVINVTDSPGDNEITATGTGQTAMAYYNDVFSNNQYSKATATSFGVAGGRRTGVAARISGSGATRNAYVYYGTSTERYIIKYVNGTQTQLDIAYTGFTAGDTLEIRVNGTTISVYVNGLLDTSLGTDGEITDSDLTSGKAGVVIYYDGTIDDWEGGNL